MFLSNGNQIVVSYYDKNINMYSYKGNFLNYVTNPSFIKGLADWVWRQREQYRLYRQGQPSTLTTTRIAKLTELGFEFIAYDQNGNPVYHHEYTNQSTPDNNTEKPKKRKTNTRIPDVKSKSTPKSRFKDGKWLQCLAKVVAYKEANGTCNVPRKWKPDPTLGEWVHFQRRQYRLRQDGRHNHMTEERIHKLESIGFEWSRGSPNPTYAGGIRMHPNLKDMYTDEQKLEEHAESMMQLAPINVMDDDVDHQGTTEHHIEHHHGEHHVPLEHEQVDSSNMESLLVGDDQATQTIPCQSTYK